MFKKLGIAFATLMVVFGVNAFSVGAQAAPVKAQQQTITSEEVKATSATVDSQTENVTLSVPITIDNQNGQTANGIFPSESFNNKIDTPDATDLLTATVIRSGNTTSCEVYLNWAGDNITSGWRFLIMNIKNTNLLFPTTYGQFGNGSTYTTYNVPASSVGSVRIGRLSIPTDVNQVRVEIYGLQGYSLSSGWISAVWHNGNVDIN